MAPLVWLITGCSSGFGKQFVQSIRSRGDNVIATGRNAETKLQHLKDTGAAIVDLDICLPQAKVNEIIDQAAAIYGGIDVLINNAGIGGTNGFFEELSNENYKSTLDVNFFGPMTVTRAVIPHMRKKQSGTIAFNGSMYGFWSPAMWTSYCVTKHAIEALASGLRNELEPFGIRTMVFEPGFAVTDLLSDDKLQMPHPSQMMETYSAPNEQAMAAFIALRNSRRGEAKKMVELMIDVIRGEGPAEGLKLPEKLPIGEDAINVIETRCRDMLALIEKWRSTITSTDRDDYQPAEGLDAILTPPPIEYA